MSRRSALVAIVVLGLAAGVMYWTRARHTPAPAPQAADAWLALRMQLVAAAREDDVLVVVTGYDRRARQAAAVRDATGGQWKGSGGAAAIEARSLPAGWPSRLRLEWDGGDVPFAVVREAGGEAVLRVEASRVPAPGVAITATLTYDAGNARSNAVTVPAAPDTRMARLVALAQQAEIAGDDDRLLTTGAEMEALAPDSSWGPYFTGVALERRGDRAAAAEAFKRALARAESGQEAPIGLVARIRRLSQ